MDIASQYEESKSRRLTSYYLRFEHFHHTVHLHIRVGAHHEIPDSSRQKLQPLVVTSFSPPLSLFLLSILHTFAGMHRFN